MRVILCCFLFLVAGFSAQAQWLQVRSSAPSTALRLFSYQQVDFGKSGVMVFTHVLVGTAAPGVTVKAQVEAL